jgi:hypothetical protein
MKRTRAQRADGQASMEYLVVCAALALALGVGMADQDSVLWQLVDAFSTAFRKFSYAISLPG